MADTLRIFLCSTYEDLIDERRAVLESLRDLQLAHDSMEYFGARPSPAIEACLAEVAKSSMLVLVVGHRYGSLVPGQQLSFTETEYREGQRLGKVCLVYMRHDDVPVLPKYFESDPEKLRALESLKRLLNERHTVARFRTAEDLVDIIRSNIRETLAAVEASPTAAAEAFFAELRDLAASALADGLKEAILLSAFRTAVDASRETPPTLPERLKAATRAVLNRARRKDAPWVFFSYAQVDRDIVDSVAKELPRYGVRVWVDRQDLVAGQSLLEGIRSGLTKANGLVFFASKASLRSQWTRHELDHFMAERVTSGGGPPIIPVLLEDVELPGVLRDVLYLDMRRGDASDVAIRIAAAVLGVSVNELSQTSPNRRLHPALRAAAQAKR